MSSSLNTNLQIPCQTEKLTIGSIIDMMSDATIYSYQVQSIKHDTFGIKCGDTIFIESEYEFNDYQVYLITDGNFENCFLAKCYVSDKKVVYNLSGQDAIPIGDNQIIFGLVLALFRAIG